MSKLDEYAFNLKFMAKSLARQSTKMEKEEKASKLKCKRAMEKGNQDSAKIYAQNAIRQKNEALNYLRLSSRIDAVSSRMQSAAKTAHLTKAIGGVVKNMDSAMQSMNLELISKTMDQFEKQFEDLDVRSEYMDNAMNMSTSMTTPDGQVQQLMQAVADEHNLELSSVLNDVGVGKSTQQEDQKEDLELEARLKRLQGI